MIVAGEGTERKRPRRTITRETLGGPRRILIVDDDQQTCARLQEAFQGDDGLLLDSVTSVKAAWQQLECENYSIVLTDLRMPKVDGLDFIKQIQQRGVPVTIIVMTAFGSVSEAVEAMRLGAYDFLSKPLDVDHLRLVFERALRERTLQDEIAALHEQLRDRFSFHNVLSKNAKMHEIFETITNLSRTNTTVLIEGETGTGKEQLARAIHLTSERKSGPWVAVNCAALPESLLESELFGHEKGSFTSAASQRKGRFELADGGTLFLDEVGDIPATMQAKLLRVLQERCFERVGGTQTVDVDVRVVAATNRDLLDLVRKQMFREDLYYRINVVKLPLPPLRERSEDISLLAEHFVQKYAADDSEARPITPEAMEVLLNYHWPGNIRELENAIERACVTSDHAIQPDHLPSELMQPPRKTASAMEPVDLDQPLKDLIADTIAETEEDYVREALREAQGDVGKAAEICRISRRNLSTKIAQYGIDRKTYKPVTLH